MSDVFLFGAWAVVTGSLIVALLRARSFGWRLAAGVALNAALVMFIVSPALVLLLIQFLSLGQ